MPANGFPRLFVLGSLLLAVLLFGGCSGGSSDPETTGASGDAAEQDAAIQPTGSFVTPASHEEEVGGNALPPGTPEALVREIIELRVQQFPQTDDVEQLRALRQERNQRIIALAQQAIVQTHQESDKEQIFNAAVHHLMEASRQLALAGDREQIDALYQNAEALYQEHPDSRAAADAAYVLAGFAHENARRFAEREPRWLEEFAHQARLFATRFGRESGRAAPLLLAAAWSCELHGMHDEALSCYLLVREKFPNSPQAEQAAAVLRRLHLKGKTPQLAGPELGGGYTSLESLRGHVVLVVFWDTANTEFLAALPAVKALFEEYQPAGLRLLGVNLNEHEEEVTAFLKQHALPWPQIFDPDPAKRRWENPIVKHYGVRHIPQFWLLDRDGRVVETNFDPARQEHLLRYLLGVPEAAGP